MNELKQQEKQIFELQQQHHEEQQLQNAPEEHIQEQQNQVEVMGDVEILREEAVQNQNLQLENAPAVFATQGTSIIRQRDPQVIRESGKKARRKQVAQEQKENDLVHVRRMTEIEHATCSRPGQTTDELLTNSMVASEKNILKKEPPREDVEGDKRRTHEKRYAKISPKLPHVKSAAKKDVANLIDNLRRDLAIQDPAWFPQDMKEFTDAYHLSRQFGEDTIKELTMTREAMKEAGRPQEEIDAISQKKTKLEAFVLWQKGNGSNYSITMGGYARDIEARKLAKRQIMDEGDSKYHQLMIRMIDEELNALTAYYNTKLTNMRTANGTHNTPKGAAQIAAQAELARLYREMSAEGVTEEQKLQLEQQAKALVKNYDY